MCISVLFGILPILSFRCDLLQPYNIDYWMGRFIENICDNHQIAVRNTFLVFMTIHLIEAVVASMMCSYMDCEVNVVIKWTCSVFIHGILSFKHLLTELYAYENLRHEPLSAQMKLGLSDFSQ